MTTTDKLALIILVPALCIVMVVLYLEVARPNGRPDPVSPHHVAVAAPEVRLVDPRNNPQPPEDRRSYITCYKPPDYPLDGLTASGMTVAQACRLAMSMKLDGICAVSCDWQEEWNRVKTSDYAQLCIRDGTAQGVYLVVDRTAKHLCNVVDVWYNGEGQWNYQSKVICLNPKEAE